MSFLFAGEGPSPLSRPHLRIKSIDFMHFTAVFSLSINHVGEL